MEEIENEGLFKSPKEISPARSLVMILKPKP